jgi:hypothetical protein
MSMTFFFIIYLIIHILNINIICINLIYKQKENKNLNYIMVHLEEEK